MRNFKDDYEWQERHLDEVIDILRANAHKLMDIRRSSLLDDMKNGSDIEIPATSGSIGVRMRRDTDFRDLTIRSRRSSGATTEMEKIRSGCTRWYLYVWFEGDEIVEWWLIDIDELRDHLDDMIKRGEAPETVNHDGRTAFRSISRRSIEERGAMMARWPIAPDGWDF